MISFPQDSLLQTGLTHLVLQLVVVEWAVHLINVKSYLLLAELTPVHIGVRGWDKWGLILTRYWLLYT